MTTPAERIAALHRASEFTVGDEILFGKYKNKRGRVLRFYVDDRGVPMVEIEPVPKGRKQNREMGLYNIWHLPERRMGRQAAYSEDFLKAVRGQRFRNPATGKKVLFQSLPPEEQRKVHDRWKPARSTAALPVSDDDLRDALEHAGEQLEADWNLDEFERGPVQRMTVDDVSYYDDVGSWAEWGDGDLAELSPQERRAELESFRGKRFADAAEKWIEEGRFPPIVIVDAPDGTTVGDGRGRVSVARGMGLPLDAVVLKHKRGGAGDTDRTARAREIAEMGYDAAAQIDTDELDRVAFGVTQGVQTLPLSDLKVQYDSDLEQAEHAVSREPNRWKEHLDEPIEVRLRDGEFHIEDGHHRYVTAKRLGRKDIKVDLTIDDNPVKRIFEMAGKKVATEQHGDLYLSTGSSTLLPVEIVRQCGDGMVEVRETTLAAAVEGRDTRHVVPATDVTTASMRREACIIAGRRFDDRLCLLKNRDRAYDAELEVLHLERDGTEMAVIFDTVTGYLEGVNEHGIGVVNTTLMVVRDEAEGKAQAPKSKGKGKKPLTSKDGPKIFRALACDNLDEAVASLRSDNGGIRGHTFVADGKRLVSIECSKNHPARVHELDPARVNTRTNHGISYPDAGYTHGDDYISSVVRRWEAQKRLQGVKRPEAAGPALWKAIHDADSPFNPVRTTDKMRTTSQLTVDTTSPALYLYLVPDHAEVLRRRNLLPDGRAPKIPVRIFRYRTKAEDRDEIGKSASRVAARYKSKKKVKTEDGEEMTVYEYSDRQIANRNRQKAERVEKLRGKIEKLRETVRKDVRSDDEDTRGRALAVALMDETYERPGNDDSASDGHDGVTTWKAGQVSFRGGNAKIKYVGKSGVDHVKTVASKWLVKALREACADKGKDACVVDVTAADVNDYLKPYGVTSKDIRGFHANREVKERLKAIRRKGPKLPEDRKDRERLLKDEFKRALEEAAEEVGHEPSTLRSQYLVPGLEEDFMRDGTVRDSHAKKAASGLRQAAERGTPTERRLLASAIHAPTLVARPRTWWIRNAPNVYRIARCAERPRPSVEGLQFSPELFAVLWYADEEGNRIDVPDPLDMDPHESLQGRARYMHSQFPCELNESILRLNDDGTSTEIMRGNKGFPRDLVTAMVRSGEWDVADAIMVAAQSCERCLNVLLDHYGMDDGYPFGSDEYWEARTRCKACEHVDNSPEPPLPAPLPVEPADGRTATKTEAEREDEDIEKMLRKEPKKNPPRYDLRDNRTLDEEDDSRANATTDRDLSLKWDKVARRVVMRRIARDFSAKDGDKSEFQRYVDGKKFRHPKTRGDVAFSSLPSEEQTQIYQEWKGKQQTQQEQGRPQDAQDPEDSQEKDEEVPSEEKGNDTESPDAEVPEEKTPDGKSEKKPGRTREDVEVDLDNARDEVEELESDVEEIREDMKAAKQAVKELKKLLEKASPDNRAQIEANIKEQKGDLRRLDDQLEQKTSDLKEAQKRVNDLKAERKDPGGTKEKLEQEVRKKRQEKVQRAVSKAQQTMKEMVGAGSDLPREIKSQLEKQLNDLDDAQVEDFSLAFASKMRDLRDQDPMSDEAVRAANEAAEYGDLVGLTDPDQMAERLAQLSYATNVVANPMNVGGKPVGTTEMTDETYGDRAREAFDQFRGLHSTLRKGAVDRVTAELKKIDPDTHRAKELNAILTGIDLAQIADTGDSVPGRPQASKGHAALIRKMIEMGETEKLFKPAEDFFGEDARRTMSEALGQLDPEDIADLATGDEESGYEDLHKLVREETTPDVMKEMIKDFLAQDMLNDMWGDRAVRDTMAAAGVEDSDDPEVRARIIGEAKRRGLSRRQQVLEARERVAEAERQGAAPDDEDVRTIEGYFDAEAGEGLRQNVRALFDVLKDKFKKVVVSPATAVLNHFLEKGDPEVLSQETDPHPDEKAADPRPKEERERSRGDGDREDHESAGSPSGDDGEADPSEDEDGLQDEDHGPGDVWKTDEGNWRAKNPKGAPKTFKDRQEAQQYARAKGDEEGFSADFKVPVEDRGPTRFASQVADGWLARVRSFHPDDPARPILVVG